MSIIIKDYPLFRLYQEFQSGITLTHKSIEDGVKFHGINGNELLGYYYKNRKEEPDFLSLSDITHSIKNIRINSDDWVYCDIHILDTTNGKVIQDIMKANLKLIPVYDRDKDFKNVKQHLLKGVDIDIK